MATASIILNTDAQNALAVVRLDNRGSAASLEADLGEFFASLGTIPLDDPPRLGALLCDWYGLSRSTVKASVPTEPDYDDTTHALLNCSAADAEGRPVGELLTPSSGDVSPLSYGG